jgi:hypothetical protein
MIAVVRFAIAKSNDSPLSGLPVYCTRLGRWRGSPENCSTTEIVTL